MKIIASKSFKKAQSIPSSGGEPPNPQPSNSVNPIEQDGFNDGFEETLPPRKDKEYFASIGVRMRVVSGNPQQELQFAQQAFEAIKEQIQSGVQEDNYEAWLSGYDEEPQAK